MDKNKQPNTSDMVEISWPDVSRVELLRQHPFAKPEPKKRPRPRTWKNEWESMIIDASPYAKHVAPVKAKHIPTAGEIAERRLKKIKEKLDIHEGELPSANQMGVEEDFDLKEWKNEMEAMQLLLGPSAELAAPYPMTSLREEINGKPPSNEEMKRGLASYEFPRYKHQEFEDTAESWKQLGPEVPSCTMKEGGRQEGKCSGTASKPPSPSASKTAQGSKRRLPLTPKSAKSKGAGSDLSRSRTPKQPAHATSPKSTSRKEFIRAFDEKRLSDISADILVQFATGDFDADSIDLFDEEKMSDGSGSSRKKTPMPSISIPRPLPPTPRTERRTERKTERRTERGSGRSSSVLGVSKHAEPTSHNRSKVAQKKSITPPPVDSQKTGVNKARRPRVRSNNKQEQEPLDAEEKSRRRLAAFLEKTTPGHMEPSNLPRSLEMKGHTAHFLQSNLGTGLWQDQVGSTLARPMDAAMVHCPSEAIRSHPETAPALVQDSGMPESPQNEDWDVASPLEIVNPNTPDSPGNQDGHGISVAANDHETTSDTEQGLAESVAGLGTGMKRSIFLKRQAQLAVEEGDEETALALFEEAAQGILEDRKKSKTTVPVFPYDEHIHGLARRIQKKARRFLAKRQQAAGHIQRVYRGHCVRVVGQRAQQRLDQAASYIQNGARRRLRIKIRAATRIEAGWRGKKARAFCRQLRMRNQAAIVVQKYVRRLVAKRLVRLLRTLWKSAKLIQCNYRGYLCRADRAKAITRLHQIEVCAANSVLKRARGVLGRLFYKRYKRQCIKAEIHRRDEEHQAMEAAAELAYNRVQLYLKSEEGKLDLKLSIERIKATDLNLKKTLEAMSSAEKDKFQSKLVFDMFDLDGSQTIDATELKTLTRSLGVAMTEPELRFAMKQMDKDNSGDIEFEEFYAWLTQPDTNSGGGAQIALLRQYLRARRGWQAFTGKDKEERAINGIIQRETRLAAREAQMAYRREVATPNFECADCHQPFCLFTDYQAHFKWKTICSRKKGRGNLFPEFLVGQVVQRTQHLALMAFEMHNDEKAHVTAEAHRTEIRARFRFQSEPWKSRLSTVTENILKQMVVQETESLRIQGRKENAVSDEMIERAFEAFDFDGGGTIDIVEFGHLASALKLKLTPGETEDALNSMDKDQSGEIDMNEFIKWYRGLVEGPEMDYPDDESVGGDTTPLNKEARRGKKKTKKKRKHKLGGDGLLGGLQKRLGRDPKMQLLKAVAHQEAQCLFIRLAVLQAEKKDITRFRELEPPDFSWYPSEAYLEQHDLLHLSEREYTADWEKMKRLIEDAERRLRLYDGFVAGGEEDSSRKTSREGSKQKKGLRQRMNLFGNAKVGMIDSFDDDDAELTEEERQQKNLVKRVQIEMARFLRSPEGQKCLQDEAHRLKSRKTIESMVESENKSNPTQYLRYLFNLFDQDGSGTINGKELPLLVNELGLNLDRSEMKTLKKRMDRNGDGHVDFNELERWFAQEGSAQRANMKNRFHQLRKNKVGFNLYLHHARLFLMAQARAAALEGKVTLADLERAEELPLIKKMKVAAQKNLMIKAAEESAAAALKEKLKNPRGQRQLKWALDKVSAHSELNRLLQAACLSEDQKQMVQWRAMFQLYDTDESGKIEEEELQRLMNTLGMPCTESEVIFLLKELDKDSSGHIDFEEFHDFISKPGPVSNKLKKRYKAKFVRARIQLQKWSGREESALARQMLENEARATAREGARKAMLEEERLMIANARTESARTLLTKSTETADSANHVPSLSECLSRLTAVETSASANGRSYARTHRGRRELATRSAGLSDRWESLQAKDRRSVTVEDELTGRWFFGVHKCPWLPFKMDRQEVKYLSWHLSNHWGSAGFRIQPLLLQQLGFNPTGEYNMSESSVREDQMVKCYTSAIMSVRSQLGIRNFFSSVKKGRRTPDFKAASLEDLVSDLRALGRTVLKKELNPVQLEVVKEDGVEESKESSPLLGLEENEASSASVEDLYRHIQENTQMKQTLAEAETTAMEEADDFLKTKAGKRVLQDTLAQVTKDLQEIERDGWLTTRMLSPHWEVLEDGDDIEKELISKAFALLSRDGGRGPLSGVDRNEVPFMFELLGVQQEVLGTFIFHLEQYIMNKPEKLDQNTISLYNKLVDATSDEVLVFEEVIQLYERLRATLRRSDFLKLMYKQKKASRTEILKKLARCSYMRCVREKARRIALNLNDDDEYDDDV